MGPRKKNPAIKASGATSSKAAPLPDWVKGGGPKPPPSYTKAGKEALAAASASVGGAPKSTNGNIKAKVNAAAIDPAAAAASARSTGAGPRPVGGDQLFPPGTKTPLALLNERVQKLPGWERVQVDAKRVSVPASGPAPPSLAALPQYDSSTKQTEAWSCVVTLRKANKNDASNPFVVRMEPEEPGLRLACPTSNEARHWAATYVLFRIFSTLPLYRVLPAGPREYWQALEAVKKDCPATVDWKWESDPFEAQNKRLAAAATAATAAAQNASNSSSSTRGGVDPGQLSGPRNSKKRSRAWEEAKDVRMAPSLRELVEQTVRSGMEIWPEAQEDEAISDEDADEGDSASQGPTDSPLNAATSAVATAASRKLEAELVSMGFRPGHARSAAKWVATTRSSKPEGSVKTSADQHGLLASVSGLSDQEAAMEYLAVFTPEDDLPPALRPDKSSDPFVTGAAQGTDAQALALRWSMDRLVKDAGYPRAAVLSAMQDISTHSAAAETTLSASACEGIMLDLLNHRLIGGDVSVVAAIVADAYAAFASCASAGNDEEERQNKQEEERLAVEAVLGEDRVVPVSESERPPGRTRDFDILISTSRDREDVRLRICIHPGSAYPSPTSAETGRLSLPTFYIASRTLPAYLRLALTSHLSRLLRNEDDQHDDLQDMLRAGDGGCLLALVEELEICWQAVVSDPPELADVMRHIVPRKQRPASVPVTQVATSAAVRSAPRQAARAPLRRDRNMDERLRTRLDNLGSDPSYSAMQTQRGSLPAAAAREDILALLSSHRVTIIAGETGCGKTTQVPQFILEDAVKRGEGSLCNIVVTQPRRVSAMGVAARVANEMGEDLGKGANKDSLVGYAIRGERKAGPCTRLLFSTTGVILRRLGSGGDSDLASISHLIVDEVHERSVDSDFLLLELREVLKRNPDIKIVLMSATINQETFSSYFAGAPCLEIPGRTFPVQDHYLEEVMALTHYRPSSRSSWASDDRKMNPAQAAALRSSLAKNSDLNEEDIRAIEAVSKNDRIDYDLLGAVAKMVCQTAEKEESGVSGDSFKGALLIFLPGVGEIRQAVDTIRAVVNGRVDVLPLHANLAPEEQRRVFAPSKAGTRKIVVVTNVAETSITIPEIVYVIDTGRVKETRFEPESGLTRLVECWASRAACRQRRGRAGRTRPGQCYKLFTRFVEDRHMTPQQMPEMKRVPLESLFLQVKAMREDEDVRDFLGKALSPPSTASMETALHVLTAVGAIHDDKGYKSKLTALGRHLSALPLDLRLGKLIVLGAIFGCLGPMLTVAAVMSCKPLFVAPFDKRDEANKARAAFMLGNSDLLCDANAFDQWARMRADKGSNAELRDFCDRSFIAPSTLRDIASVRLDLISHLEDLDFVPRAYVSRRGASTYTTPTQATSNPDIDREADANDKVAFLDLHSSNVPLLRSLILAALYPSLVRVSTPSLKYAASSSGAIALDPEARQVKLFDPATNGRVFLHPSSCLFHATSFSSSHLAVFRKSASGEGSASKIYLRDATEAPLYALLLFGGKLKIHSMVGGITVGEERPVENPGPSAKGGKQSNAASTARGTVIHLKAGPRIAVLCRHLRRLLDAHMQSAIENPLVGNESADPHGADVIRTMITLVTTDGRAM